MKKAQVYAIFKNARVSAKKARLSADLIRGKKLSDAKISLLFDDSKASFLLLKTLKSAEANAKHNKNMTLKNLFVSDVFVDEGQTLKRGRIVGRGRFSPIVKRSSSITIGLSAKEEK